MKLNLDSHEFSGSIADIGMLLPLLVALVSINNINALTSLLACGLFYILASLYYRVPIPVQPLKVFCTVAIATQASPKIINAGALVIGIVFIILSIPCIMQFIKRWFSIQVIRGIQLGTGLLLVESGIKILGKAQVLIGGSPMTIELFDLTIPFASIIGIVFLILLFTLLQTRKYPVAIIMMIIGVLTALFLGAKLVPNTLSFSSEPINEIAPSAFLNALWILVLPQIPLSLGNAIIATENTLEFYFGEKARHVTPNRLSLGMGLFNILAGLVGAMPCCHGSSGVTAHYRFGARTGKSTFISGIFYLALALLVYYFGASIFSFFPYPLLGVLLIYSGIEHGLLIKDVTSHASLATVLIIASISVAMKNMTLAFLLGIIYDKLFLTSRPLSNKNLNN